MASKPCNGHESWNAWNVALWIGSDETLYRTAMECIRECKSIHRAANMFNEMVGMAKTPDGARFSHHSVELALGGFVHPEPEPYMAGCWELPKYE